MTDNSKELEQEPSEEDNLLFSVNPGTRAFILSNPQMTNVFGLVLDENDDSFLVGLPAIKASASAIMEPFVPLPYVRLLKSSVMLVMYLLKDMDVEYLRYAVDKGGEGYPEILGSLSEHGDQEAFESSEEADFMEDTPEVKNQQSQGLSNEELEQYLLEKFRVAGISDGSRKKQ